jgi:hypothetical protein
MTLYSTSESELKQERLKKSLAGTIRWFAFIALLAFETVSEHFVTSRLRRHPFANRPRRIVADVLVVTAGEMSDPVAFVVDVVAGDRLLHFCTSPNGTIGLVELGAAALISRSFSSLPPSGILVVARVAKKNKRSQRIMQPIS